MQRDRITVSGGYLEYSQSTKLYHAYATHAGRDTYLGCTPNRKEAIEMVKESTLETLER